MQVAAHRAAHAVQGHADNVGTNLLERVQTALDHARVGLADAGHNNHAVDQRRKQLRIRRQQQRWGVNDDVVELLFGLLEERDDLSRAELAQQLLGPQARSQNPQVLLRVGAHEGPW